MERHSVDLTMCPKCREKYYDMTLGRCFSCGYSTWSVRWRYGPVKILFLASLATTVVILLFGLWLWLFAPP